MTETFRLPVNVLVLRENVPAGMDYCDIKRPEEIGPSRLQLPREN